MKTEISILVLFFICIIPSHSYANKSDEAFIDATYDAGGRTLTLILNRLNPHLANYAKPYADRSKFAIVASTEYGAYKKTATGKVAIQLGLIMETRSIFWAYQDINDNLALKSKFPGYLKYLTERQQRISATKTDERLKSFSEWNGHAQKPLTASEQKIRLDQDVAHLVDALSFVVAHELAHLVLEHKDASTITDKQSKTQENEADLRAIRWIQEAGFDPIPATQVLIRMAAAQISPSNELIQNKTHDHPLCRVWVRFAPVISRRRNDPAINEGAIKAGYRSAGDLVAQMTVFKEACQN